MSKRLMLGVNSTPELLVSTEFSSDDAFNFWVINGAWEGTFNKGMITVYHPEHPFSSLDVFEILCSDQDRLQGDYTVVFENFHNIDFVGKKPAVVEYDIEDIVF